jgi:hypothetical protein
VIELTVSLSNFFNFDSEHNQRKKLHRMCNSEVDMEEGIYLKLFWEVEYSQFYY